MSDRELHVQVHRQQQRKFGREVQVRRQHVRVRASMAEPEGEPEGEPVADTSDSSSPQEGEHCYWLDCQNQVTRYQRCSDQRCGLHTHHRHPCQTPRQRSPPGQIFGGVPIVTPVFLKTGPMCF